MEKNRLFVDIETSGLSPAEGAVILSMGVWLDTADGEDFCVVFNRKPSEEEWAKASPDALKINGMTWDYLQENGLEAKVFKLTVMNWLVARGVGNRSTIHIGQNPSFDILFMNSCMGVELEFFNYPTTIINVIDLAKLVQRRFHDSYKFENFKGWGIARAIGVEEEGALHTADGGVQAVRRNYYKLMEILGEKNDK